MKSSIFVVAMLMIMSMTSCTASENDPMEEVETIDMLSTYGARNLNASDKNFKNLHLDELPGVSVSEASAILANIRKHTQSQKHYDVKENLHGDHYDVDIVMDETVSNKSNFTCRRTTIREPCTTRATMQTAPPAILHGTSRASPLLPTM